jgi:3',5'-cyclic AMP phosphodiesterase CpdA
MRTIVHLSDLHFGRVDAALLDPLVAAVHAAGPDVVVVSGDLTQRAKPEQFQEARAFLDRLPRPQVVVPGNHDVPLYNVVARFLSPLDNYRQYIDDELETCFIDEEIAVCGVNTARSLTFKNGRINCDQLARIRDTLYPLPPDVLRVVVTHHPFDVGDDGDEDNLLGRAAMAMGILAEVGVDLLLSGHLHATRAADTTARYQIEGYAALVVQAGTATSTRGRGEPNSFNVIRASSARIEVEHHAFDAARGAFHALATERFRREGNAWIPDAATGPQLAPLGDDAPEPVVLPVPLRAASAVAAPPSAP